MDNVDHNMEAHLAPRGGVGLWVTNIPELGIKLFIAPSRRLTIGAHKALTTELNHKEILAWCLHKDKLKRGNSIQPDKASVNKETKPSDSNRGGGVQSLRPTYRLKTHPPRPPLPLQPNSYKRSLTPVQSCIHKLWTNVLRHGQSIGPPSVLLAPTPHSEATPHTPHAWGISLLPAPSGMQATITTHCPPHTHNTMSVSNHAVYGHFCTVGTPKPLLISNLTMCWHLWCWVDLTPTFRHQDWSRGEMQVYDLGDCCAV